MVVVGGYHGWHDWYIGTTTRDRGVPKEVAHLTDTFVFNDASDLERVLKNHAGEVAAVVLEPAGAAVPEPGYLDDVVELARRHGALSVFDEIITGFRLAPGGARQRYTVEPDISCYGKALGNGMPIAAVAGRWQVMEVFEEIFFSGTHGGEALSLAAARVVLDTLADGQVLRDIEATGQVLLDGIRSSIATHDIGAAVGVGGEPQRAVVSFSGPDQLIVKSFVQQTLARHGMLFNGSMFICARHSRDDIERTLHAFSEAFREIATGEPLAPRLVGPAVLPVFRDP
jgi:glutamate-1-semialdehyde 2,1-aminomutase/spore coat polysaccharide biosynthesis protein SpsF